MTFILFLGSLCYKMLLLPSLIPAKFISLMSDFRCFVCGFNKNRIGLLRGKVLKHVPNGWASAETECPSFVNINLCFRFHPDDGTERCIVSCKNKKGGEDSFASEIIHTNILLGNILKKNIQQSQGKYFSVCQKYLLQ